MCTGLFDAMLVSGFYPEDPVLPADHGECSVPQVQHHNFLWKLIMLELWVSELAFSGIFQQWFGFPVRNLVSLKPDLLPAANNVWFLLHWWITCIEATSSAVGIGSWCVCFIQACTVMRLCRALSTHAKSLCIWNAELWKPGNLILCRH